MTGIHDNVDGLRAQVNQLLRKQSEILKVRIRGDVNHAEIVEYDLRQEVIAEILERLARSAAA